MAEQLNFDGLFEWDPNHIPDILKGNRFSIFSLTNMDYAPHAHLQVRSLKGYWETVKKGEIVYYNFNAGCVVTDQLGKKQINDLLISDAGATLQ